MKCGSVVTSVILCIVRGRLTVVLSVMSFLSDYLSYYVFGIVVISCAVIVCRLSGFLCLGSALRLGRLIVRMWKCRVSVVWTGVKTFVRTV